VRCGCEHCSQAGGRPTLSANLRATGKRSTERSHEAISRATQTSLDREVAVKIIRAELANQPDFVRSFETEARAISRIEHPNVFPLYDFWRDPD
jgi:serine/threonine protein kinase